MAEPTKLWQIERKLTPGPFSYLYAVLPEVIFRMTSWSTSKRGPYINALRDIYKSDNLRVNPLAYKDALTMVASCVKHSAKGTPLFDIIALNGVPYAVSQRACQILKSPFMLNRVFRVPACVAQGQTLTATSSLLIGEVMRAFGEFDTFLEKRAEGITFGQYLAALET
jgi:hypothetical protein